MERDEWVAEATIDVDGGRQWSLQYYVHIYEKDPAPVYGLRVDKRNTDAGQPAETETTPAITASFDDAAAMARVFAKGSVPPCVLLEVADEYLS